MEPSRPPLLVLADDELDRFPGLPGWSRRDDFALPPTPWDLSAKRIVCVGSVVDQQSAEAALTAAARGAALAITVAIDGRAHHQLLEDLHKVAEPIAAADAPDSALDALSPLQQDLLSALADGATVSAAASALHVSRRTANRLLADARDRLGVDSTAAAVRRWVTTRWST